MRHGSYITFTFGFILYVQSARKKWEHITIVSVNVIKKKPNKQYYHGALWFLSKNLHVKKQSTTPLPFVVTSSQQQFSKQKMSRKLTCASVISEDHHRVKSWPTGPKFMLNVFPAKHDDDKGSTIQYNHTFSQKKPQYCLLKLRLKRQAIIRAQGSKCSIQLSVRICAAPR